MIFADFNNDMTTAFNGENCLSTVTNQTANPEFVTRVYYNGDGTRVKKEEQQVGGSITTTLYVGPIEVVITATGRITTSYYAAGGQVVAMRKGTVLSCLHSDHLGSTSLVTSNTGSVVSRHSYYPYGGIRTQSGTTPTDIGFTAQRNDVGIELMDFKARAYSPYLLLRRAPDWRN